ncbi:MAG: hypothetical protein ABI946_10155 [Chthoniobacterales bacterium]
MPLIAAYRKYCGTKAAAYITGVLFVSMVSAGIVVDLVFAGFGLIPEGKRPEPAMSHASFEWNYTTWLNIVALIIVGGILIYLHFRKQGDGGQHAHGHDEHSAHAH